MIYEATIQYISIDKRGNDKVNKEKYIIGDAETFTDVERKMYEEFQDLTDIDVITIKRSGIKEIANTRQDNDDKVFLSTLIDVFTDDNGEEKETKYLVAFYAKDIAHAYAFIREYIQQGYNLDFVELKKTKFIEVI